MDNQRLDPFSFSFDLEASCDILNDPLGSLLSPESSVRGGDSSARSRRSGGWDERVWARRSS